MKLLKLLLPILLLTLFSCDRQAEREAKKEKYSAVGEILKGKHELRKFKTVTEKGFRVSGSYFLIAGGMSGGTYENHKVAFSFQLPDSTYAMGELWFSDIRVKIDSTIKRPYVKFHWDKGRSTTDMAYVMRHNVNYMVVHCKEEDFPYEVNITDL